MAIYQPINLNETATRLSFKGADDSTFTVSSGKVVDKGINLLIKNPGNETKTDMYFQVHEDSISIETSDVTYSGSKIYGLIESSIDYEDDQPAIIEFNITSPTYRPEFSSVVASGLFQGNNSYSLTEDYLYSDTRDLHYIDSDSMNSIFLDISLMSTINSIDIYSGGSGYKLGTVFTLSNNDARTTIGGLSDASITGNLSLNSGTVSISGGESYQVGETFTVTDSVSGSSGIIQITEVAYNSRAITKIILVSSDNGFTNTPSVTYNGSNGSGATITINDNYTLGSVTVNDGGEAYPGGINRVKSSLASVEYDPTVQAILVLITESYRESGVSIKNNFILADCKIKEAGNNLNSESDYKLFDNNKQYNFNDYITINAYIDIDDTIPNNDPVFFV
jgi:hypothetical protein